MTWAPEQAGGRVDPGQHEGELQRWTEKELDGEAGVHPAADRACW